MFKRKEKHSVMLAIDPKAFKGLEKRVKQLECSHDEWQYYKDYNQFFTMSASGAIDPFVYVKRCKHCEKSAPITQEQWLQEQADEAYKKHESFVEQINELNTETEK